MRPGFRLLVIVATTIAGACAPPVEAPPDAAGLIDAGGLDAGAPIDAGAWNPGDSCDSAPYEPLHAHAIRYASEVHPLLVSTCTSCHSTLSTRSFQLPADPIEAFATAWDTGRFARDNPDGLFSRVSSTSPYTRMPQGTSLTAEQIATIDRFTCGLARYEKGEHPVETPDAGTVVDAGEALDAGEIGADAGEAEDAGELSDAGELPDAGESSSDAGEWNPGESCASRPFEPLHIHAIRYATEVHPLLSSACVSCHSPLSLRSFRLPPDPAEAFVAGWDNGRFVRGNPDGLFSRVSSPSPYSRMPQGSSLTPEQIATIDRFTCALERYELGENPVDPPDAGDVADAGEAPDAGETLDAGETPDAGEPIDAGPTLLERYTPENCPPGEPATLEAHAERFAAEIHPILMRPRAQGGCASCHAMDSGRTMRLDSDGIGSFYRLRGENLLDLTNPASLVHRVARRDSARMPPEGPPMSEADSDVLYNFTCGLLRGPPPPPADEVFPPELLQPWTGAASTTYDNTTLTYAQLKGRIQTQFGDAWIRDGVDQFAANVARFGGVDFRTAFVPQKQVTADYLLGLEAMSKDVCLKAATDRTGPFTGLDLDAPILEEPPSVSWDFQLENATRLNATPPETPLADSRGWTVPSGAGRGGSTNPANQLTDPRYLGLWSNWTVGGPYVAPITGTYRVTVRARGTELPPDLPNLALKLNGVIVANAGIPADADTNTRGNDWTVFSAEITLPGGEQQVGVAFTNDAYKACPSTDGSACGDRNLLVDWIRIEGPLPGTTVGEVGAERATKDRIALLLSRTLLRPAVENLVEDELTPLYDLLFALETLDDDREHAWAGLCEGLLQHPDFLFTRRPSAEGINGLAPTRALFVRTALDLLDRPPNAAEFSRFDAGVPRETFIDEWLASGEFRLAYFHRVRLMLESDGSSDADEPARLWLYLAMNDAPIRNLLTAGHTTRATRPDLADLIAAPRFAEYGNTGLLVMRGYLKNKPGLPHYNYAARVLSDFLGHVFEVPPDIVDTRAGSTPTSTVQPGSVCFSCHQLLTPLSHQRAAWADDGNPQRFDAGGQPIDDSDRNMVPSYPYRGRGMAAFADKAVKKERFLRRMANSQVDMLLGRPMRHDTDERALYRTLWNSMNGGAGSFRSILRLVLVSPEYTRMGVLP